MGDSTIVLTLWYLLIAFNLIIISFGPGLGVRTGGSVLQWFSSILHGKSVFGGKKYRTQSLHYGVLILIY